MRVHNKILPILFLSLALPAGPAAAEVWAGVIVGDPTGFSLKTWQGRRNAWDIGAGWSLGGNASLNIKADYLVHRFNVLDVKQGRAPVYFGIGGQFRTDPEKAGVRVPVGVDYLFADAPLDIFAELAPTMLVAPETDFDIAAAIGIRYHF